MVALWIFFCAFFNCVGWGLSALHGLNETGYAVALLLAVAGVWWWREPLGLAGICGGKWHRIRRRTKRFFPAAFFILSLLVAVSGLLHAPSNYDGLAYRMPRILHWLAEGQWHWIHTDFERLNTRATGYEWIATPILLFTHSIRPVFLIGLVSFLLLPGLVFSLFTRLGINRRVAWHWMWLAPTGYCFVLQAGGIGNDVYGATLALAAFDFSLRARASGKFRDLVLAFLAVGLLTGAKTSNIPLVFPCAVALLPCWRVLLVRPLATAGVIIVAAAASFLPMAMLNYRQCGDWTGAKAEEVMLTRGDPRVTIPGNTVILTLQNFVPPVFPMAKKWNEFAPRLWPGSFGQKMKDTFEASGANLALPELQNEEGAGFGFGTSLLAVISLVAGWWLGRGRKSLPEIDSQQRTNRWLRATPLVAAFGYFYKATIGTAARIVTPYYLVLLPLLLSGRAQAELCRRRWWRVLAVGVFLLAALLVIVTPSRPLWPAQTILTALVKAYPDKPLLQRALTVYSVYSIRADGLAPVREKLPASEKVIGLVTFDDLETSLWLPFQERRFRHIAPRDTREDVLKHGIRYVAINSEWFPVRTGVSVEEWLQNYEATIETTVPLRLRAGRGEFNWHIVRLQ